MITPKFIFRLFIAIIIGVFLLCIKLIQAPTHNINSNFLNAHKLVLEENNELAYSMPRTQHNNLQKSMLRKSHQSLNNYWEKQAKKKKTLSKVFTKKWKKEDFVDKKKKIAKKTEKKKKEEEKKKAVAKSENKDQKKEHFIQNEEQKRETHSSPADTPSQNVIAATNLHNNTEKNNESASFEAWKNLLINQPNRKNTNLLIEHYVLGKLSENNFYQLVVLMMENQKEFIRQQGITALNATTSTQSFRFMSHYYHSESIDSPLRNYMRSYLDQYASLSRLKFLQEALQSDNETTLVEVTQVLNILMQNTQSHDGPLSTNSSPSADEQQLLSDFIPLLENIQHDSSNVNQAIEITLNALTDFIS